jgi:hypothetical protein
MAPAPRAPPAISQRPIPRRTPAAATSPQPELQSQLPQPEAAALDLTDLDYPDNQWREALHLPVPLPAPPLRPLSQNSATAAPLSPICWAQLQATLESAFCSDEIPDQFLQNALSPALQELMWKHCLDDKEFTAAVPNQRVSFWEAYFTWAQGSKPLTAEQVQVLEWLRTGITVHWVHVHHPAQLKHPRFRVRLELVTQKLHLVFPDQPEKVQELLSGNRPGRVHFPNRKSAFMHAEFTRSALHELVATQAIEQVGPNDVIVVSGLGVVINRKGKARLILDATYINLFDKYVAFSYEQLKDIIAYAQQGDWLSLTDFKSGYHHFLVHPDVQPYLGLEFEGKFYRFRVLPFGLASACRSYTRVMLQSYLPLRNLGQRMSFLIDDACFVFSSEAQAAYRTMVILLLLTALGFCLSRAKCSTLPSHVGKFLGLLVDLLHLAFHVPRDKAEYILAEWAKAKAKGYTKRDMARIAGMLVSIAPAVPMAPLYTRRLFQAMGTVAVWDTTVSDEAAALAEQDHVFWQSMLSRDVGLKWHEDRRIFVCAGDASAKGYGGYSEDLLPAPMVESFTEEEQRLMEAGQLSSTHREVRNMCLLVHTCLNTSSELLRGQHLLVYCDNMGAVSNFNTMNGKPQTLAEIRGVYQRAFELDVRLSAQWLPRESSEIARADDLSRVESHDDYALSHSLFKKVCQLRDAQDRYWGYPTGDAFASTTSAFHKAPRFFTRFPAPTGNGADGLLLPWSLLDPPAPAVPLVWAFPPRTLVKRVIAKILAERRNTILLVHSWPKAWDSQLTHLPVIARRDFKPSSEMFVTGSRFPDELKVAGQFMRRLTCFLIRFPPTA